MTVPLPTGLETIHRPASYANAHCIYTIFSVTSHHLCIRSQHIYRSMIELEIKGPKLEIVLRRCPCIERCTLLYIWHTISRDWSARWKSDEVGVFEDSHMIHIIAVRPSCKFEIGKVWYFLSQLTYTNEHTWLHVESNSIRLVYNMTRQLGTYLQATLTPSLRHVAATSSSRWVFHLSCLHSN